MPSLRELGEVEILRRLTEARGAQPGVVVGAGDDAAVLEPTAGAQIVATCDAFVEGRHYLPEWLGAEAVGARLAAANLSDLAAMAAVPRWALLSMGLRADHDVDALLALQQGMAAALSAHGAGLVGGNLAAVAGPEWYAVTLLGEAKPGRAWTRAGARPGDLLAVTGRPGRAGAGVRLMRRLGEEARAPEWRPLLEAWLAPEPRVALATALADAGGVTAAIDLSDGMAGDLAHACDASGVGVELDERDWAADPELERAARRLEVSPDVLRLAPSDDYELLLAVDPEKRAVCEAVAAACGVRIEIVGRFTAEPARVWKRASGSQPLPVAGYDHFGG